MPRKPYSDKVHNGILSRELPYTNILGVEVAVTNMDDFVEKLHQNFEECRGNYITIANVHTTIMAYKNSDFMKVQNGGIAALPDGGPLSKVGKKRGYDNMARITGPDFMNRIFKDSKEYGYSHYFYGSDEATLNKLVNNIKNEYPYIKIAGYYSPPYKELTPEEDKQIIEKLNTADADYLWIGLGAPKQEKWMAAHQGMFNGVMVGVGAAFDYGAGNIKRAPKWMQDHCLEWSYRLIQDPKRLFKRYLTTNAGFVYYSIKEKVFKNNETK